MSFISLYLFLYSTLRTFGRDCRRGGIVRFAADGVPGFGENKKGVHVLSW